MFTSFGLSRDLAHVTCAYERHVTALGLPCSLPINAILSPSTQQHTTTHTLTHIQPFQHSHTRPNIFKSTMATNQPPQASLTGIPPELRNIIYNLVADDIKEAIIIGRKLKNHSSSSTAGNAQTHFWNAVAKHPLGQTCKVLRQEFGSIHQHRVISTGVDRYWLDLKNFDLDPMGNLANVIRHMPTLLALLRDARILRVRLCIGKGAVQSVETFQQQSITPNRLSKGHQELQSVLNHPNPPLEELKIMFRTMAMSRAERRSGITHADYEKVLSTATMAILRLGMIYTHRDGSYGQDHNMLFRLPWQLRERHREFYREQRRARERKASGEHQRTLLLQLQSKLRQFAPRPAGSP